MTAPTPETPATEPILPAPEATPAPTVETPPAPAPKEFTPITSQEDFDRLFGKRWAEEKTKYADYDELKADAQAYREAEDAKRDALEKANERIAEFEKAEAERAEATLRTEVAEAAGIPAAWAKRLRGTTQAELEADAADLAESLPKPATPPPSNRPEPTGGGLPPQDDSAGFDPAAIAAKLSGKF